MNDTVIKINGLGKQYRLGQRGANYNTLRDALSNLFMKKKVDSDEDKFIWALLDIDLDIKRGDVVGMIGRNGAGKSTLLKILSRITEPTTGQIELEGRVGSLLEVGTGFHPELTGKENIYLNGSIIGMKKAEIARKFDEIVAFSEIERFIETPVKFYSSGMYVRLAFAVAAHLEPEILLVDEVLAVGDIAFQKKCLGKMQDVASEGRTIAFVSHNMAAIKNLCNTCVLLENGRLVQHGKPQEVINRYVNLVDEEIASVDLSQRKGRKGSQRIKITELAATDDTGNVLPSVPCGSAVTFVMKFSCNIEQTSNLRFAIVIRDRNTGVPLVSWNSYYISNEPFECKKGEYQFCITVPKMPLSPGRYKLGFIITSGLDVYDWLEDAADLKISEGLFFDTGQMPLPGGYPVFFSDATCGLVRI